MENRKLNILFKSKANNCYYLDEINNQVYLLHPLFYYLISNTNENDDTEFEKALLKYKKEYPIYLNGILYTEEDLRYYLDKVRFFRKHGILKSSKANIFYTRYSSNDVQKSIENTNQIVIEMTENCNLRCVYCTYGNMYGRGETRTGRNIDVDFVKDFLLFLITNIWNASNKATKRKIRIDYYGGEPLIKYKSIVEITEFLKNHATEQLEFNFSLTTNATLLTEQMLNYFAENRFILTISIDGNYRNNSYRVFATGDESFDILKKNIDFIKDNFPNYFNDYVYFTSVLHDRNSIEEIHEFLNKNYNKSAVVGNLNPNDLKKESISQYNKMANQSFNKGNDKKAIKNLIEYYTPYIFQTIHELMIDRLIKKRYPSGTCMPLQKKIFITTNRYLLPCEKIDFNYYYIQLKTPFQKDKIFKKVALNHSQKLKQIRQQCGMCYYNWICDKCLFNNNNLKKCVFFMTEKKFRDYLCNAISLLEENPQIYYQHIKSL